MPTGREPHAAAHCDKSSPRRSGKGDVSLAVLPADKAKPAKPHSTRGKWRALVLILIHVAIIAHVIQWLLSGERGERSTLSPVEPSESMFTLEQGLVNAGFVMFVLAIASTLLLGRFFCGWACHVVALQDLCAWMMKKIGIHPKPWRSRLLVWVPLLLALYMFVWPTFRREVVAPLIGQQVQLPDGRQVHILTNAQAAWLGTVYPLPKDGFQSHFIVEDFWATFPPWYVAIPFLGVCGFAVVYFLGAKGFCTYGCPYGGFFAPADAVAPVRIRVTDACEHCGHCTAVCTSNVRVHEEVRDFGMVVDPGCMKCMDCVSACPNDALYVGLGKPALLAKPRTPEPVWKDAAARRAARYDLTWREEFVFALVFLLILNGYRGMYGNIPLLMAVGIAGIGTFMVHKTWRLLRDANVRGPFRQLKKAGRVTPLGWGFALFTAALLALGAQGLYLKVTEWIGAGYDQFITPSSDRVFSPGYTPEPDDLRRARIAIDWYRRSAGFADGGAGFFTSVLINQRLSWLSAVSGDYAAAERHLRAALEQQEPGAALVLDLVNLRLLQGAGTDQIVPTARPWLERWPFVASAKRAPNAQTVLDVARLAVLGPEGIAGASRAFDALRSLWPDLPSRPADAGHVFRVARDMDARGRTLDDIRAFFAEVLKVYPLLEDVRRALAMEYVNSGRVPDAVALYRTALKDHPTHPAVALNAGELFLAMQQPAEALAAMEPAVKAPEATAALWEMYGTAQFFAGQDEPAAKSIQRAIDLEPSADRYTKLSDVLFRLGREPESRAAQKKADELRQAQPVQAAPAPAPRR